MNIVSSVSTSNMDQELQQLCMETLVEFDVNLEGWGTTSKAEGFKLGYFSPLKFGGNLKSSNLKGIFFEMGGSTTN